MHLDFFGLSDADLDQKFYAGNYIGLGQATLREIIGKLEKAYAQHVGIEFKYISDQKKIDFLTHEMEEEFSKPLPLEKKRRILDKLNQGVIFEKFLHTKYVGQKRFSLEGGETTIAALDAIINTAAEHDVQEVAIGMAHRGRLNVLANIMGKTYEHIFSEFEGTAVMDQTMGSGDVKYHMGYGSELISTSGKPIYLKLMPNPSHLEAVDPVVVGFSRAKADVLYDSDFDKILPILIHGDASVAGQGIVYEVLQMSNLRGYYTGGTIHFVINNQIGFTTDSEMLESYWRMDISAIIFGLGVYEYSILKQSGLLDDSYLLTVVASGGILSIFIFASIVISGFVNFFTSRKYFPQERASIIYLFSACCILGLIGNLQGIFPLAIFFWLAFGMLIQMNAGKLD